ncbi:MAG: ribbon-helix-helix domain-containing protein [Pseudohongiellaceae bacterium]
MARQHISFTLQNDEWLKAQVDSNGYTSKSDVVNALIRKAREESRKNEYIRAKLAASEKSVQEHGWVEETPQEMLDGFKEEARRDGKL